jgi:hypothetical protein
MMARLEHAGWVDGWYDQKIVDGQIIKERRYELTPAGAAEWTRTRQFYVGAAAAARKLKRGWADA